MEKMFKRSVLGAAIAFAAISGSAQAAIDLNGEAVQVYGQAAANITFAAPDVGNDSVFAEIETRIGFRGRVQFDDFAPDLVWQVEGGNAGNGGYDPGTPWTHANNGAFGARDTFVGFAFDGIGKFTYGRQLVAAYNYVDWPHSNPGIGTVFDWNNDIGASFEDRANNVIRFDSATWSGFNFQATLSGMGTTTDAMVMSVGTSYTMDMFSVHAGYYSQDAYQENAVNKGDNSYAIVGGSVFLGDVTLTAAWKGMENNAANGGISSYKQDAYSATAQYVLNDSYVFKLGYAGTTDTDGRAVKKSDGDTAVTGRLGYLLPSTYLYFDVRYYDKPSVTSTDTIAESKGTNFLLGAEYYF